MTSPRLSAVIIVKDEQINLSGLIANLYDWIHEIVLIDDASTDDTHAIAGAAGDKVRLIEHPMRPELGFSGQRNAGIDAATGDWLLHMDCDERISDALRDEITIKTLDADLNALRYRRLNYFMHRPMYHGGWTSWNRPQIARKGAHHFEGVVHETCVIAGGDTKIGQLDEVMHHFNDHSFSQRLSKSTQYSQMEADKLMATGQQISALSLIFKPGLEFIKKYILQKGALDGIPGLIAALHSATSIFRIRALVWDRQNAIARETLEARFRRK